MNINKTIEKTLSGFVSGKIYPMVCTDQNKPEKYIVYNPALEKPAYYADNHSGEWVAHMQVHYFAKGNVNAVKIKRSISDVLESAGFCVDEVHTDYENETRYTHITFACNAVMD